MHTSKKIKTRNKNTLQYTSKNKKKCVPKILKVHNRMELYKKIHKEKIISNKTYHLVVSLHICWRKLMDKRTRAAKATPNQGRIERRNVDLAHIQSFCEYCTICKLLVSPSSAQHLPTTTSMTGLRASWTIAVRRHTTTMAAAEEIRTAARSHCNKNLEKQKNNNRLEKGENLRLEEKMKCKGRV